MILFTYYQQYIYQNVINLIVSLYVRKKMRIEISFISVTLVTVAKLICSWTDKWWNYSSLNICKNKNNVYIHDIKLIKTCSEICIESTATFSHQYYLTCIITIIFTDTFCYYYLIIIHYKHNPFTIYWLHWLFNENVIHSYIPCAKLKLYRNWYIFCNEYSIRNWFTPYFFSSVAIIIILTWTITSNCIYTSANEISTFLSKIIKWFLFVALALQ